VTLTSTDVRDARLATLPQRTRQWLHPAWPLQWLLIGFPLWWMLGLGGIAPLLATGLMAWQLARSRTLRLPAGFGLWVLFLAWMLAGALTLWVHAPGTLDDGGPERLVSFGYRVLWYLAATVMMLYPLAFHSSVLPSLKVARWMGALLVTCLVLGLAGLAFPNFGLTSLMELIVPGAEDPGYLRTLLHPSLTTASDFLGYEQPRPKAPFAYANAWGNNVGLLIPFFVIAWLTGSRWRAVALPVLMGLLAAPVAFSLNRGLWLGIGVALVYLVIVLVRDRRWRALYVVTVSLTIGAILVVASPLWATISLRLATGHSDERRETVAVEVTRTTWEGSPLLGFGTTRKVSGNFESIAGGQTPACRQCAAPPLGTQGFTWRLIFTTGFVGAGLFVAFMALQFFTHVRRREPEVVVGCILIAMSAVFFVVYDSLEFPMLILMVAIGLMNRTRLEDADAVAKAREQVTSWSR
jgi:hypothetical protein